MPKTAATPLSLKWLAWLHMAVGKHDRALTMLCRLQEPRGSFLACRAIAAPLFLLRERCARLLGQSDPFELEAYLGGMEKELPGITARLEPFVAKAKGDTDEQYAWNVAMMMPFYFS